MIAMSLLVFVRNRATNVLPLILGLFFKVSGTSSRVMTMLSNVGLCVSGRTVERLKKRISDDAIAYAVELMTSGHLFCTTFVTPFINAVGFINDDGSETVAETGVLPEFVKAFGEGHLG